ncbi:anti-sigma factor [Spirillospora sp. NPDC047279]|uniref:anti-sigma factor n=1 Tax=Spirillospora sp. NPDC047279 TaxID=3155478 RepID=UPI0033F0E13B
MTTPHDTHALVGAYALDALSDVERRRFQDHLDGCDTCRNELRGLRETTAAMAFAAAQEPPAELRDRVMERIAGVRQVPPRVAPEPQRRGFPPWLLLTTAAASVVLALVLGVYAVVTQQRLDETRAQNERIAAVITAPDARLVQGPVTGGGSGTVVAARSRDEAVVIMEGLPTLASAKTYQLWLMGRQAPRSVGTMTAADTGPVLAAGLGDATEVGITVEPEGGSPRPTGEPVFTAGLSG